MGTVTTLPQPHGDRKFFLAKDLRDSAFSNESESNSSLYHCDPAKPHVQLRGGNRDTSSSDRRHHTTPIGILAEQGSLNQVRGRNGLGHLPCLCHGGCSGHLDVHQLGDTLP